MEQLPKTIFNINLNDIHTKMKGVVNLGGKEGRDACLSDSCELGLHREGH